MYSTISPGWQAKALQIASNVENRIALALPFFKIERLLVHSHSVTKDLYDYDRCHKRHVCGFHLSHRMS